MVHITILAQVNFGNQVSCILQRGRSKRIIDEVLIACSAGLIKKYKFAFPLFSIRLWSNLSFELLLQMLFLSSRCLRFGAHIKLLLVNDLNDYTGTSDHTFVFIQLWSETLHLMLSKIESIIGP